MDASHFYKELETLFQKDSKLTKIISGIGALIFGLLAVYYFITQPKDYLNNFIILFGFLGSAVWLFSGIRKGDLSRNEAYQKIRRENGNIVWIYPENTIAKGGTSRNVKVMNRAGKEFVVPTGNNAMQDFVIQNLSNIFPDAVLGYSAEIEKEIKSRYSR